MSPERDRIAATKEESWPPTAHRKLWLLPGLLFRAGRRALEWLVYERRLGVTTMASPSTNALAKRDSEVPYHPSRWRVLKGVLDNGSIGPEDVFVDFGAGLGRVVIQAAQHPFGRVIGVEISPELSATARANVDQMRTRLACPDVEIVTADATRF